MFSIKSRQILTVNNLGNRLIFLCIIFLITFILAVSLPMSAFASTTKRLDVTPLGSPDSSNPRISRDGRIIAFDTSAEDLYPGDTNDREDVLAFDRTKGTTKRVSLNEANEPFDVNCFLTGISGDGRYVVFVADDPSSTDIYIRDLENNTSSKVSLTFESQPINPDNAKAVAITPDGRYLAFYARTSNTGYTYVFVHDLVNQTTERVSVTETSEIPNESSLFDTWQPISDDGRYVTFVSNGTNVVSPDNNGTQPDVFLYDRSLGNTVRVNQNIENGVIDNSYSSAISGNGQYIAFTVIGESGTSLQYIKNLTTGQLTRIGLGPSNIENGTGSDAVFSTDGRYLAFRSQNNDIVENDNNGAYDIFRLDTSTGEVIRVSYANDSSEVQTIDGSISMSGDGRVIAFSSPDDFLVDNDTNSTNDIFIRDLSLSEFIVEANETVTTDEPPSETEPIQTSISSPVEGEVIIHEQTPTLELPGQYSILSQESQISAPSATPENPLVLTFRLDSTAISGANPASIEVFRNGVAVPNCTTSNGTATPNPCVSNRIIENDGDVTITVFTAQASVWNFAKKLRPISKDDCKGNGWQLYTDFRNQGNCVSFIAENN